MSHNSYAVTATVTGTSGVSATVNGRTYSGSTSNNSASLFRSWDSQTAYIYNGDLTALCFDTYNAIPAGSYFSVSVRLGQYSSNSGTNTNAIGLHNTFAGFSSGANWALISQNVESLDNTYIVINVTGLVGDTASTGFCFSPANGSYIASNDVSFSNFSIVVSPVSFWINDGNGDVVNGLNDVEDAIKEQTQKEEDAASEIENQDTSDIDTGDDSSATNLIGNISTLFNQISSIQASSSCNIAADFGNLDLGNLNLCTGKDKLPFVVTFGAYAFELIFVVGTAIILIKQVLGLFDWARS